MRHLSMVRLKKAGMESAACPARGRHPQGPGRRFRVREARLCDGL